MVELKQHIGLQKLRLNCRGAHGDNRLMREDGRPLRHGPDVAGELEIGEVGEEALVKDAARAQILDILGLKVQLLHVVYNLLKTGCDGKTGAVRHGAVEDVEIGYLVLPARGEVAVAHGQLVKIAQHGQIDAVCSFHNNLLFFIARRGFPAHV